MRERVLLASPDDSHCWLADERLQFADSGKRLIAKIPLTAITRVGESRRASSLAFASFAASSALIPLTGLIDHPFSMLHLSRVATLARERCATKWGLTPSLLRS